MFKLRSGGVRVGRACEAEASFMYVCGAHTENEAACVLCTRARCYVVLRCLVCQPGFFWPSKTLDSTGFFNIDNTNRP